MNPLVLQKVAFRHMHASRFKDAIDVWRELITAIPDWEHGMAQHYIAQCYEDTNQIDLAKQHYLNALNIEPGNYVWLGGYAAFLYDHGDPSEAHAKYREFLQKTNADSNPELYKQIISRLEYLGSKLHSMKQP